MGLKTGKPCPECGEIATGYFSTTPRIARHIADGRPDDEYCLRVRENTMSGELFFHD